MQPPDSELLLKAPSPLPGQVSLLSSNSLACAPLPKVAAGQLLAPRLETAEMWHRLSSRAAWTPGWGWAAVSGPEFQGGYEFCHVTLPSRLSRCKVVHVLCLGFLV